MKLKKQQTEVLGENYEGTPVKLYEFAKNPDGLTMTAIYNGAEFIGYMIDERLVWANLDAFSLDGFETVVDSPNTIDTIDHVLEAIALEV